MKKLFTFCFFAFALLIGTQSALGQNKAQLENKAQLKEKAYLKAKELRSVIKFNDNTLEQVYDAYYANELKMNSILDENPSASTEPNEATTKANTTLEAALKTALGTELYDRYLMILEKKKITD